MTKIAPTERDELQSRLRSYSTLSAAALATAAAVGTTAVRAQIQNITTINVNHAGFGTTPPDLVHPANFTNPLPAVAFTAGPFHGSLAGRQNNFSFGIMYVVGHLAAAGGSRHLADKVAYGHSVTGLATSAGKHLLAQQSRTGPHAGQFAPLPNNGAVTGYIVFKSRTAGNKTYDGWLHVKIKNQNFPPDGFPNEISLIPSNQNSSVFGAYVLSTDPSASSFEVGQIAAIPEPATVACGLGLLALGAAGVREMRRRRLAA